MACDMVAALGRATADEHTLFGHNSGQPARQRGRLQRTPGRAFAPDEKVRAQHLELAQARQTFTVLGGQAPGVWGYQHGVNEYGVAAGRAPCRTRLPSREAGLTGADLVRLALERSRTARQAVDLLTDLVSRHGQAPVPDRPEEGSDNAFLVADAGEAFAVETAGHHWVCQEVRDFRLMTAACTVRQDWERIAPGLAGHAIAAGWWPADGSKLDFGTVVSAGGAAAGAARRRWEQAVQWLGRRQGPMDLAFLRRFLAGHGGTADDTGSGTPGLCRHTRAGHETAASLVVQLAADPRRLPVAWCALGPPCRTVYFPVFLEGELPADFTRAAEDRSAATVPAGRPADGRAELDRLQARFDQEAEEFAVEGAILKQHEKRAELQRQATLFMQHCLERFGERAAAHGQLQPASQRAALSGAAGDYSGFRD